MKFALKYWWYTYKIMMRASGKMVVFFLIIISVLSLLAGLGYNNFSPDFLLKVFLYAMLFELVVFYGFFAIKTAVSIKDSCKFYEIVENKGYCMEAFDYFQQTFILGKPVNEDKYIQFASLYCKFGDYDSAMSIMNSIQVPESNIFLRSEYIYVFMKIAIYKKDTVLADNIWNSNQRFIDYVISENKHGENINVLHLAMIYADSIAGRYERAFKICDSFLKSEHMKKFSAYKEKFLVLKIYLLKKLEKEAEMNTAITEFNNYVSKKWKPLLEVNRTELRDCAEKAIRGEIPV